MSPPGEQAGSPEFSITQQQASELTELAGRLYDEAGRCAQAGCWSAALVLISGSAESALLATACVFEPELRDMGIWRANQDPARWTLGRVATVARKAGWLPSVLPDTRGEIFANLDGQVGDAVRFVERLRNMIVHPGAYIREALRPDVGDEEHMRLTYQLIDGILAEVFDRLTTQMNTLSNEEQDGQDDSPVTSS